MGKTKRKAAGSAKGSGNDKKIHDFFVTTTLPTEIQGTSSLVSDPPATANLPTDIQGSTSLVSSPPAAETSGAEPIQNQIQSEPQFQNSPPANIASTGTNSALVVVKRDPGKRKMIWEYAVEKRDDVRRAYITLGPYQVTPPKGAMHKGRRFSPNWYTLFRDWMEYSPTTNKAYCLPCFVFGAPSVVFGSNAFVKDGYQNFKKANEANGGLLTHVGSTPSSSHNIALRNCHALMNPLQNIDKVLVNESDNEVGRNRLRLKVSIDVVKLCALQAIALRGHDEKPISHNHGNFLEIVKFTASYNNAVALTVMENAPKNATYTSPKIQKEILSIYGSKIHGYIRDEIGDAKFCIIVDESRDESKSEQMAIVLRFVDKEGFLQERFFDLVHVEDTKAITLKNKICEVLARHNLSMLNIRGQGYDGASNMRGEWNGLQALFLSECPYSYYVHCFAHRLQLTLVATCQSVIPVERFFLHLNEVINSVDASAKRHDQLQLARALEIEELISTNELETGSGQNQVTALQRPGDTRWSSHLKSIYNLFLMFGSVSEVLVGIINDKCAGSSRGAADRAYDSMMSFEFIFIMHFLIELLGRADDLCRILQCKSQDIVNAMDMVSSTEGIIRKFREAGWNELLEKVNAFCVIQEVEVPDLGGPCKSSRGQARKGNITWEHHYRVDIFCGTIDCILQEMKSRFNEDAVELLKLSLALDPKGDYKSFNINDICKLVEKFYPADFTTQEQLRLKYQLELFEHDIQNKVEFKHMSTLSELCQLLSKTEKSSIYPLVDRLIRLILTLPVSTATSERAFSAMKIVKTRLRSKMGDDFLSSALLMNIERKITRSFDVDSIIDEFDVIKKRRVQFRVRK